MHPTAGDHLIVARPVLGKFGRLYSHHGIYLGSNQVIHYAGLANGVFTKGSSRVQMLSLEAFTGGHKLEIHHYDNRPFHAAEIVVRARARLGENRYNLVFNNCEHFAHHCCIGEHASQQVRKALLTAASVVTSLALRSYPAYSLGSLAIASIGLLASARRT